MTTDKPVKPFTRRQALVAAASLRDQLLDVHLGNITHAEWTRRADAAEARGATLPDGLRTTALSVAIREN